MQCTVLRDLLMDQPIMPVSSQESVSSEKARRVVLSTAFMAPVDSV